MAEASQKHFGAVYITLASVLLGLALEDLVSIVRAMEERDAFVWVTSIFVVHIIMNAWIAYTSTAVRLNLDLHPWDALNVFVLSAAHFAINSFVASAPAPFLVAVGAYSLTAAATVYSASLRGRSDPTFRFPHTEFRPLIALNMVAGVTYLLMGWVSSADQVAGGVQFAFVTTSIPFATGWLLLFWRIWRRALAAQSEA